MAGAASLKSGEALHRGGELFSDNGKYMLTLQASDGHLVLYRRADMKPLWYTNKFGGDVAIMQPDRNFVVYKGAVTPPNAIWNSETGRIVNDTGTRLTLNNDGSMQIFDWGNFQLWSTPSQEIGTTPGCTTAREYAVCVRGATFQFNSIVLACSVADARAQAAATGASYGACY